MTSISCNVLKYYIELIKIFFQDVKISENLLKYSEKFRLQPRMKFKHTSITSIRCISCSEVNHRTKATNIR